MCGFILVWVWGFFFCLFSFLNFSLALWDRSKLEEMLVDLLTKDKESFREEEELFLSNESNERDSCFTNSFIFINC